VRISQATAAKELVAQLREQLEKDKQDHGAVLHAVQTENQALQAAASQIEQELLRGRAKAESLRAAADAIERQLREQLEQKTAELAA
jgi:hypothetical protein